MNKPYTTGIQNFINIWNDSQVIEWTIIFDYHANNTYNEIPRSESFDIIRELFKQLGIVTTGIRSNMSFMGLYPKYKGLL